MFYLYLKEPTEFTEREIAGKIFFVISKYIFHVIMVKEFNILKTEITIGIQSVRPSEVCDRSLTTKAEYYLNVDQNMIVCLSFCIDLIW